MTPTTAFRTVLGTNRKVERSRVWLEGKRVAEAGFAVGSRYRRIADNGAITLVLVPEPEVPANFFKVSGKGDKPIIDTAGKVVLDTFRTGTHVVVTFEPGVITIRPEPS